MAEESTKRRWSCQFCVRGLLFFLCFFKYHFTLASSKMSCIFLPVSAFITAPVLYECNFSSCALFWTINSSHCVKRVAVSWWLADKWGGNVYVHIYAYFKEFWKCATFTRSPLNKEWHLVVALSTVCKAKLFYITVLMNSFWHLHGIVAGYQFQNPKHSRVFLSFSKICCIKKNRQTTKADLAGQQVHHTSLFTRSTFNLLHIQGMFWGWGGRVLGCVGTLSFLSRSANSWDFCPQSQWSAIVWFGSRARPHQSRLSISCSVTAVLETLQCSVQ